MRGSDVCSRTKMLEIAWNVYGTCAAVRLEWLDAMSSIDSIAETVGVRYYVVRAGRAQPQYRFKRRAVDVK